MATRAARAAASSALIRYSKVDESSAQIRILGYGGSNPRWASSSSSSKPNKKMSDRLSSVIDAVNDRKLPPELRGQRNAIRSETEIINVVEQRIWHSMEEGQFDNLPGKGKPLPDLLNNCSNNNPHADPAEDTLYRILSRNNCAPEWVELNKEIRNNIAEWRSSLHRAVLLHLHTEDGRRNNTKWIQCSDALKAQLRAINDKVFRYNLIVPFGRQMFGLKWEKELGRCNENKYDC